MSISNERIETNQLGIMGKLFGFHVILGCLSSPTALASIVQIATVDFSEIWRENHRLDV